MDKALLHSIFLPTLNEALEKMDESQLKLAHYTSFEVAQKIIEGEAVWMRDVCLMNDIGEVKYGIQAVDAFMAETSDRRMLVKTLNAVHAGLGDQILPAWQQIRAMITTGVYIACFSEHLPGEEDFGRLSMWRAYCTKPDGVALVLNTEPFRLESNALNAYSSPVFYGSASELHQKLRGVLASIDTNIQALREYEPHEILNLMMIAILFGAVCLKHPGFSEEKEWRVIYMSMLGLPSLVRRKEVTVRGREETVFEIPLKDAPEQGLIGIEVKDLIHQIIIGPSNRTERIRAALSEALGNKGVINPANRILASEIPLRVED